MRNESEANVMKLKSYFSATVEAAMDLARKELGDEALLINARPTEPATRYLGAYEVVFGVAPVTEPAPFAQLPSSDPHLREDLADMRRQIERLMLSFPSTPEPRLPPSTPAGSVVSTVAEAALLAEEVTPELASAVCAGRSLAQLFTTDPTLSPTVALVGPPGAGKTATLVKLAVSYGLAVRRPVRILSTDVFRIAAIDQLRALAAILGIPCDVADTPLALSQFLDATQPLKGLMLIDTPGFAFREMDEAAELAQVLASSRDVDTHLVLPASMKFADLSRACTAYRPFRPRKLLFTRMDETSHYGALVNLSAETNLPVSFLCSGQQIPDDLEEATSRRIEELILGDHALVANAVRRMGAAA